MTKHTAPAPDAVVDAASVAKWLTELRADVAESVAGVMLRGARVVAIGAGGTPNPATSAAALVGWCVSTTDGNAATVRLRDGVVVADGDPVVATLRIAAGATATHWFGPGGLNLVRGLVVEVVSGSIEGAVYLRGAD